MNALTSLLVLAATVLAALVVFELRPRSAAPADPTPLTPQLSAGAPPTAQPPVGPGPAALADILLARPLFSQTRRPPNVASPAAAPAAAATSLPRMTGILIDGPRRSAIFASQGKPTIVAEGGRIGPFTVQTIEPQQVIVVGPEGRRTVRTSFDPTLPPPAALPAYGLGAPQFPGITPPAGPPLILPPAAPSAGYGLPQSAGAAR